MTCTPGKDAAAEFVRVTSELPALVLYLDPVNMAIQLPSSPDGAHVLAKFCRELVREAAKLADELDPAGGADATPPVQVGEQPVAPSDADGTP